MDWLSSPLIIRLFPYLDYHESVILQKTSLKGLILIIKSTYQGWNHSLMPSCAVFPWRSHPRASTAARTSSVVWNLTPNAVIDVFWEDEKARVLNVVDRHCQYLAPRWYKWVFTTAVSWEGHSLLWSFNHYLLAFEHLPTRLVQVSPSQSSWSAPLHLKFPRATILPHNVSAWSWDMLLQTRRILSW